MPCVGSTSSCCDGLSGDRGREVKNVGDGLMVVFPSSSVAADVAVAMQQNVAHTTTPTGEALGLRVGIAVGDAEADELDYFGRPVVEAARLCGRRRRRGDLRHRRRRGHSRVAAAVTTSYRSAS